jgi:hypothetical protein
MDALRYKTSIGISELREAPARAFESVDGGALIVLKHKKPVGYIVSTAWMERGLNALTDRVVAGKAIKRLDTRNSARVLNPTDL